MTIWDFIHEHFTAALILALIIVVPAFTIWLYFGGPWPWKGRWEGLRPMLIKRSAFRSVHQSLVKSHPGYYVFIWPLNQTPDEEEALRKWFQQAIQKARNHDGYLKLDFTQCLHVSTTFTRVCAEFMLEIARNNGVIFELIIDKDRFYDPDSRLSAFYHAISHTYREAIRHRSINNPDASGHLPVRIKFNTTTPAHEQDLQGVRTCASSIV